MKPHGNDGLYTDALVLSKEIAILQRNEVRKIVTLVLSPHLSALTLVSSFIRFDLATTSPLLPALTPLTPFNHRPIFSNMIPLLRLAHSSLPPLLTLNKPSNAM